MIAFSDEIAKSNADYVAWSRRERRRLERDPQALQEAVKSAAFFWLSPEDRADLVGRGSAPPPGVFTVAFTGAKRRPQPLEMNATFPFDQKEQPSKAQLAFEASLVAAATWLLIGLLSTLCFDSHGGGMTRLPVLERRRSKVPARVTGGGAFVGYVAATYLLQSIVLSPLGMFSSPVERLTFPAHSLLQIGGQALWNYMGWPGLPEISTFQLLLDHHQLVPVVIIGVASIAAGYFGAGPLYRRTLEATPRRLGTHWIGEEGPRWSEKSDAILNANRRFAAAILESGRGLQIAPGVFTSKAHEQQSLLVLGKPGSGKTVVIWSWLKELQRRRAKLIIHDTKGDFTGSWPSADFILLAPLDARSWCWDIGRDITSVLIAREFAAALIKESETAPTWGQGAQEIVVGVIRTLMFENGEQWGWAELHQALDLTDVAFREFATRYHPPAARFLAIGDNDCFTLNAGSYVTTAIAPIGRLIGPLAQSWGDIDSDFKVSLCEWMTDDAPERPVLILQRAPNFAHLSTAWIGAAIDELVRHGLGTRPTTHAATPNPSTETWFVMDELPQIGLNPRTLRSLVETGRSLNLRTFIGTQNCQQLDELGGAGFSDELLQLTGTLIALRNDPGKDAQKITSERLSSVPVRTWDRTASEGRTTVDASIKMHPILTEDDLSALKTIGGIEGYLVSGNFAYLFEWPFPDLKPYRPGRVAVDWLEPKPGPALPRRSSDQAST